MDRLLAHGHEGIGLDPLLRGLRRRLAARRPRRIVIRGFARAATLVGLVERPRGPALVFTARSRRLPCHAGQISFPGGKRESRDRTAAAAALREAREEIGLDPADVEVLGSLDDVATYTGFVITPVVGWLGTAGGFTPDRREVRAVMELPLSGLADPGNFAHAGYGDAAGRPHPLYEFRVEGVRVWGATGRMVHDLLSLLGWPRAFQL